MSTIITSTLLVLFVLSFIMLIVISSRMRRDYEDKLQMEEQQRKEAFSDDVIKEQENSHTINISSEELSNEVDDASIVNFKIK
ncbi:MAG: hypothetical protein [phage Lak_Megaphage_RVC_AP4_GC26]|uniref:Uncharacterized protein n=1 Tax=phage Lak_Megaphage_RVC_AP3_GC26 TaxID=3109225 RepID=A0ABZ0Z379_9CAUD|nr:MAG: hypothetical protein [phage Lak_Megaphage_RVC_AP3_GC26]WQJ52560.1 MAG: hypothetical protein [phage Lak_Megaphage_RVC_AP4_GC26]